MKKHLCLLAFAVISPLAAALDCPAAKVMHIQAQRDSILFFLEGQNWHRLGEPDHPGVQAMYSALFAAQMSGSKVVVRYPDDYNCQAYELTVNAYMLRTHNN